jgi:hypothetical protein
MGGPVERISNRCDRTPCNVTWAAAGDSPRDRQNKKGQLALVEEAVEKVYKHYGDNEKEKQPASRHWRISSSRSTRGRDIQREPTYTTGRPTFAHVRRGRGTFALEAAFHDPTFTALQAAFPGRPDVRAEGGGKNDKTFVRTGIDISRSTGGCFRPRRRRTRPPGHSRTAACLSIRCAAILSRDAKSRGLCDCGLPQSEHAAAQFCLPPSYRSRYPISRGVGEPHDQLLRLSSSPGMDHRRIRTQARLH